MMISYKYSRSKQLFGDFFKNFFSHMFLRKSKIKNSISTHIDFPQVETVCVFDCEICVKGCPSHCIDKVSKTVTIRAQACFECGLCLEKCPHKIILPKKS